MIKVLGWEKKILGVGIDVDIVKYQRLKMHCSSFGLKNLKSFVLKGFIDI